MEFTLAAADAEPDYDAQTSPHGGEIASVVKGVHSCLLHNRRWTRPVYLSSREPRDVISMRPGNRLYLRGVAAAAPPANPHLAHTCGEAPHAQAGLLWK
jgi:hypothetical protein